MVNFSTVKRWVSLLVADTLNISGQDITTTGTITGDTLVATNDLTVADDVAVNTNKFTVDGSTGNTLIAGTCSVTGDFAIATSKATIAAASGNTLIAGTVGITGATTLTGGIVATVDRVPNIPIGAVALGSLGTNTTPVAGTLYLATVWLPANKTITGIAQLNGNAVGSDKTIVSLWSSDGSALLANSALAGTTCTGTDAWQEVPFTGTYAAKGPGRFWIGVQVNGTTCRLRTIAASTYLNYATSGTPGSFGTLGTTITPTTSTTADKGPIAYLY